MAAEGAPRDPAHEPAESLIDDVIRQILDEAGPPKPGRAGTSASLLDMMTSAVPAPGARVPLIERMLLAEALAGTLADALAPALAAALAPRIMKALEPDEDTTPPEKVPSGRTRKSDSK